MKRILRVMIFGLLSSLLSALAVMLCANLVFEHWLGDKEPVFGYAIAFVVAAGVFVLGVTVTVVLASLEGREAPR